MQTNSVYSRPPAPRKKYSYEQVGPATLKTSSSSALSDMNEKRFCERGFETISTNSQSFQLPPPLPSSPRPGSNGPPPPLPPRQSSINGGMYASPKNQHRQSSAIPVADIGLYNVPKPRTDSLPPAYDTLPPQAVTNNQGTTETSLPKLMPKLASTPGKQQHKPLHQQPPPPSSSLLAPSPSRSMSLSRLVEKHQNDFPLRVEVTAGYFGESERDTFSEGDVLNIHFAKLVTVAVVNCAGKEIKVPLNSALQFSPIYDPNSSFKEAIKGFMFKNIKEVIATKPNLPLLISTRKSHKNTNNAHSVEKGDLLKIVEIKQGKFGGQSLMCLAINGGKMKRLSETCHGEFSTDPEYLKMYLPEITRHLSLPQKVIPFVDNITDERGLLFVEAGVANILRVEKEMTIVATLLLDEKLMAACGDTKPVMFEIPANLEVLEVQVIEEQSDEYEKLYADTREMLESFDPTNQTDQVRVGKMDSTYYYDIGKDDSGIELIASETIYQDLPSLLMKRNIAKARTNNEYSYTVTDRRSIITSASTESFDLFPKEIVRINTSLNDSTKSLEKIESDSEGSIEDYCPMNPDTLSPFPPLPPNHPSVSPLQDAPMYGMQDIIQNMRNMSPSNNNIKELKKEIELMKVKTEELSQYVKELQQERSIQQLIIKQLQDNVQNLQQSSKASTTNYVELVPSNSKASIKDFTLEQLLEFLDENNMSKYKEIFKEEQINGLLLSELDEEILEKDLGIVSRLHRKKLLLNVQGKA